MKIVKELRTPTMAKALENGGLKKSILDCKTKWNSLYDMLQRLLEHKDFCLMKSFDNRSLELSIINWGLIESLVNLYLLLKFQWCSQDISLGLLIMCLVFTQSWINYRVSHKLNILMQRFYLMFRFLYGYKYLFCSYFHRAKK